jgi:RNA polymerase sigma-70 factor (ECF subfamily)
MGRPEGEPATEGLHEGREEALAALYDQFAPPLFQVALRLLHSGDDAEDAVQEVFVGVVRARAYLPDVVNVRTYLFTSLRRAVADILRRRRPQRTIDDMTELTSQERSALPPDRAARLERAVQALPAEQRELLALKIDGGLTFAEIAAVLGINPNTAASRYRYALEKLRAALGDWDHAST